MLLVLVLRQLNVENPTAFDSVLSQVHLYAFLFQRSCCCRYVYTDVNFGDFIASYVTVHEKKVIVAQKLKQILL